MGKFSFTVQTGGDVPVGDAEDYQHRILCRNLWISVLLQNISDAFFPLKMTRSLVTGKRRSVITRQDIFEAREWLLNDSKDFKDVCSWAGFEPEDVRRRALIWDKSNWPSRFYDVLRDDVTKPKERRY